MEKLCISCGKSLRGRSDKKYCTDYCRNIHHNQARQLDDRVVRSMNRILQKNRRILRHIYGTHGPDVKITKEDLLAFGFRFGFSTHYQRMTGGKTGWFSYDHGYVELKNQRYIIITEEKTGTLQGLRSGSRQAETAQALS